jgi:hypothetical protein
VPCEKGDRNSIDALIYWHNTRQTGPESETTTLQKRREEDGCTKIVRPPEIRQGGLEARRERDATEEKGNPEIRTKWKNREEPEAGNRHRTV